jgi:hypothetical protein
VRLCVEDWHVYRRHRVAGQLLFRRAGVLPQQQPVAPVGGVLRVGQPRPRIGIRARQRGPQLIYHQRVQISSTDVVEAVDRQDRPAVALALHHRHVEGAAAEVVHHHRAALGDSVTPDPAEVQRRRRRFVDHGDPGGTRSRGGVGQHGLPAGSPAGGVGEHDPDRRLAQHP